MDSPLLVRAIEYAGHVHRNQKRKLSDNPFVVHPLHVALIASKYTNDTDIVIAAILHDTIEDSEPEEKITKDTIARAFNERVANIVDDVSIKGTDSMEAKRASREHILTSGWESQLVKLSDIISNTSCNITRLDIHPLETIERELGESLLEVCAVNENFIKKVTNEDVLKTGIVKEARECVSALKTLVSN